MVDKVYRFVPRKEKQYVKKFKPVKQKSVDLNSIKEIFLAFLKSKTKREDVKSKEVLQKNKPILKGTLKNVFIIIGAVIVLIGLIVGYILFTLQSSELNAQYFGASKSPSLSIRFLDSGIANIKDKNVFTPYVVVEVEKSNVMNVGLFMEAADGPLYDQVYLLNSRREQGESYYEFKKALSEKLEKMGLTLDEIYLSELETIPENSHPLIIIPSGYIPQSLCTEDKNLRTIAEKGATILYIGFGFDEGILDERRGRMFPEKDYSIAAVSKNLGNVQIVGATASVDGLKNLKALKYAVNYYSSSQNVGVKYIYGGIPVIKFSNNSGYLIMVPNTLDSGWKNGNAAAEDVALIIKEKRWLDAFGDFIGVSPVEYSRSAQNKTYEILVIPSGKAFINLSYVRVYAIGYDENQNAVVAQSKYAVIKKTQRGLVKNPLYAVSEKMSGSKMELDVYFDESPDKFNYPVGVVVHVINASNEAPISDTPFYAASIVPIKYSQVSQYNPDLNPGKYIVKLQTVTTPPHTLAQSVLIVPKINVVPYLIDWKKQEFAFTIYSPELGESDKLTKSLDKTYVLIDGDPNKKVQVSIRYAENKPVVYFKVNEPLQEGVKHTFKFEVQNGLEYSEVSYVNRSYWEQWWFWAAIVFAGLIAAIGVIFKAKEKVTYSIDIPEFEIRKKRKIKIDKKTMLDLFDKINKDYGWKYMPLSLKELKTGFRKILYMGRPIIIGDYNLQLLLDKLKYDGSVVEYLDLYSLKRWEKESGFDHRYLSLFRKTRDVLLNLAVPFTMLGERNDCDLYVKSKHENLKVVLGEGENLITRVTKGMVGSERTIIIFSDSDAKEEFIKNISKYGVNGAAIKIALLKNKLIPMTINEFRSLIK